MFYSDSLQAMGVTAMKLAVLIGSMATFVSPLAPCAQAQEFTMLEHRYEPPESGPDQSQWIGGETPLRVQLQASYREALYEPLIRKAEARYRLPPGLMLALVWAESRFNPMAISPAGAAGLAQLMPATARELGVSNLHDPNQNIEGGARYLRQMLDRFGDVHLALAAYNAGPGAVPRAGGIPRNGETPAYVRSVLRRWMAYGSS
ncbi:lytic transglycosylase domain-containing protein [Aurantiacibacter zhengii]|nr:lytic transglycosylase domain-containing protein [Aurantiacibacter zhengii]